MIKMKNGKELFSSPSRGSYISTEIERILSEHEE